MQPTSVIKHLIAAASLILASAPLTVLAASPANTAAASAATASDVPLAEVSGAERTRPFPVADKRTYFTNLRDGDRVKSPLRVAFAVSGMGVSPVSAGIIAGTGHHHILIDQTLPVDIKAAIPFDKPDETAHQHYKHFGKGETETVLTLPPGKHTLQLIFADNRHVPYYIKSKVITIDILP